MRVGYPCINLSINCKGNRTFRLKSYSEKRLIETVENNLDCLDKILRFNLEHNILFFRITSDLIPFASHPICKFNWQDYFMETFQHIGDFINNKNIRISMHPDQFTLINPLDPKIFEKSIMELYYHNDVMDLMSLDSSAKIQIHVGGVYGNKDESISRFIQRYNELDKKLKRRLVIENDERLYTIKECLQINEQIGIPVLFDVFHHRLNNNNETIRQVLISVSETWKEEDGIPMIDYSTQDVKNRRGKHGNTLDVINFKNLLKETKSFDYDVMLEIKDKEKSALKAVKLISESQKLAC
ncbi:MAG: UV DNA damage repair endonuclease UvsE [Candidatus Bathyarchaeia archaeon]